MIPLVCAMYATLTPVEYVEMAKLVSVEAARDTDDEYAVAASVMNRVWSSKFPNSVKEVINAPGQYEARMPSTADSKLVAKLSSPRGQMEVCSAIDILKGRTDFKGQSQLNNRVSSEDPMFDPKGNFYHYSWQ